MAARDIYEKFPKGIDHPADEFFDITPHDSNELSHVTRGVYVGGSGDLAVVGADTKQLASDVIFLSVPAGSLLPIRVKQVKATGTTATGLIGML